MFFTDSADFDAAAGMVLVEDFESSALGQLSAGSNDVGAFNIFLNTEDTDGTTRIVNPGLINGSTEFQGDLDDGNNTELRFDFDQPVFGFGADFGAALTSDFLTLTINGELYELDDFLTSEGNGFFGVVSDQSFESVSFGRENPSPSGKFFSIDNVWIANVPEPGCGLLTILCGTFTIFSRRRA